MNRIVRFDRAVTKITQDLPAWFSPLMSVVTHLGSTPAILAALMFGYVESSTGTRKAFIFLSFSILANLALKHFVHRPRPDTIYVSLMRIKTHSFPSGHSFGSITTYGFMSYLILANMALPLSLIIALLIWVLIFLIGLSRVYLGAHYPTDVIGGWILGAISLYLAILIF
jgi:membrane-associated phospholipid phosphatase